MKEVQIGWALIPPFIIAREDLSANEKLVFGRIMGLTNNQGFCWASNEWLGKQIGLQPQTISVIIGKLKDKKLIVVKLRRDDKRQITERQIFVRGFDEDHIPPLSLSNTPFDGHQKNSVEISVEYSNTNEDSAKEPQPNGFTDHKGYITNDQIRAARRAKENKPKYSFGGYPQRPHFEERPKKTGVDLTNVI